jgi:endonuclease/exonuclease/phosphatase family metal-dependent hydrolase
VNADSRLCREQQLQAIKEVLLAESEDSTIFMGGDFNFGTQPPNERIDEAAFDDLNEALGLTPLPVEGFTHLLVEMQLDRILARTQAETSPAECSALFLNTSEDNAIFDHAFVSCR